MKRIFICTLILLPLLGFSQSRTRHQLGFLLGGGYYIGDINQKPFNDTQFGASVFYRNSHKNLRVAQRINFAYGKMKANDKNSDDAFYVNRNLGFESDIYELGYVLEINFRPYDVGALRNNRSTPYIFGGLSYFNMNPKLGSVKLRDQHTEGYGILSSSTYSRHQITIPFGLGYKINLSNRIAIGLEYGFRKTFTDYLDDVSRKYAHTESVLAVEHEDWLKYSNPALDGLDRSEQQRGNSKNKDWYSIFGFVITFQLKQKCSCAI